MQNGENEVLSMSIIDFVVLALVVFCLALAGVFIGYRKDGEEGCNGSCASCSMRCGNDSSKEK